MILLTIHMEIRTVIGGGLQFKTEGGKFATTYDEPFAFRIF